MLRPLPQSTVNEEFCVEMLARAYRVWTLEPATILGAWSVKERLVVAGENLSPTQIFPELWVFTKSLLITARLMYVLATDVWWLTSDSM